MKKYSLKFTSILITAILFWQIMIGNMFVFAEENSKDTEASLLANVVLNIGQTHTFETSDGFTSYPAIGAISRSYIWGTNNSSVVKVEGNGKRCTVTAVGEGTATVSNKQAVSYTTRDPILGNIPRYEEVPGDAFSVVVNPPLPMLSKTTPSNNSTNLLSSTDIRFTYNADVYESSNYNKIILTDNTTNKQVSISKKLSGKTLIITPNNKLTGRHKYTATVPAGALENSIGDKVTTAGSTSFTVAPVSLESISPEEDSENVDISTNVVVQYDTSIKKGSKWNGIELKQLPDGKMVNFTASISGNSLIINPDKNLDYYEEYKAFVPVGAVADSKGYESTIKTETTFTTRPGYLEAISSCPENESKNAPIDEAIEIRFNYPLHEGTNFDNITLKRENSGEVVDAWFDIDENILCVWPDDDLDYSCKYCLTIPCMALSNGLEEKIDEVSIYFTTETEASKNIYEPYMYEEDGMIYIEAYDEETVYYTTDGSNPAYSGIKYEEPIPIEAGKTYVRAVSINNGAISDEYAETFENTEKPLNIQVAQNFGGSGYDSFEDVVAVDDGYVVVGASTEDSFGNGDWKETVGKGNKDAVIVKYDNSDNILWKKNFGGSDYDRFEGVAVTEDGYVAVGYSYEESFGSGDLSEINGKGADDAVIVKFDNNGNVVWKKNFGGSDYDTFEAVAVMEDGYVAVGYSCEESFGSGDLSEITGKGDDDAIIVKFDNNGNVVWKKNFGGSDIDEFKDITVVDNGVIAVGHSGRYSFEDGDWEDTEGEGKDDAIIVKFDNSGNIVWKKLYGWNSYESFEGITVIEDGYVAVGKSESGSYSDAIVTKYDFSGNLVWENTYYVGDKNYFTDVVLYNDFIVAVGYVTSRYLGYEAAIVKFDNKGEILYEGSYSGSDDDCINSAIVIANGIKAVGSSGEESFYDSDMSHLSGKGYDDGVIVNITDVIAEGPVADKGELLVCGKEEIIKGNDFSVPICFNPESNVTGINIQLTYPSCVSYVRNKSLYNNIYVSESLDGNRKTLNVSADFTVDNEMLVKGNNCILTELCFRLDSECDDEKCQIEIFDDESFYMDDEYNVVEFSKVRDYEFKVTEAALKELFIHGEKEIAKSADYVISTFPKTAGNVDIEWSVDDSSIATVTEDGKVKPLKNGSFTLFAKDLNSGIQNSIDIEATNVGTYISKIVSDVGMFEKEYSAEETERILYVPKGTSSIKLTATYEKGSVISDYGNFFKNVSKNISINSIPCEIELIKKEADHGDTKYTITVKEEGKCHLEARAVGEGENASVEVKMTNSGAGILFVAIYKDEILTDIKKKNIDGSLAVVNYTTTVDGDKAKVMFWRDTSLMAPACDLCEIDI